LGTGQLGQTKLTAYMVRFVERNVVDVDGIPGHGHRFEAKEVFVLARPAADLVHTQGMPARFRLGRGWSVLDPGDAGVVAAVECQVQRPGLGVLVQPSLQVEQVLAPVDVAVARGAARMGVEFGVSVSIPRYLRRQLSAELCRPCSNEGLIAFRIGRDFLGLSPTLLIAVCRNHIWHPSRHLQEPEFLGVSSRYCHGRKNSHTSMLRRPPRSRPIQAAPLATATSTGARTCST